jgi:hypothetical protein
MKTRTTILAGLLALTLTIPPATAATMPLATSNLHLDLMREYPGIGTRTMPATQVRAICTDISRLAGNLYISRGTGQTLPRTNVLIDRMLVGNELTARDARILKAVAIYVYGQPRPPEPLNQAQLMQASKEFNASTLATCRQELEH